MIGPKGILILVGILKFIHQNKRITILHKSRKFLPLLTL